jgi:hypothetical protein
MLTVKPDGSVEIKYKDVVQALTELRNYITREKMNTCYVLGITLQTMRDWWDKSFNEVFNDKVMVDIKHQNLPKDELEKHLREIASYVRKSKYPDIIRESVLCLEKLGEDKDRLLQKPSLIDKITGRFLIDEDTFKKIEELERLH